MLFSEIYGSYYRCVSLILEQATAGTLTTDSMNQIIRKNAFAESPITIPAALKHDWPLLLPDLTTPLQNPPSMPLTLLEKRWLKSLTLDPRIRLFTPDPAGLDNIEPLYDPKDMVFFDRYSDGDPYESETYISVFRTLLIAIKEHRWVRLRALSRSEQKRTMICVPNRLEYSQKDDKFRVLAAGHRSTHTVNVARILSCELLEPAGSTGNALPRRRLRSLTFRLIDERNALDRVLLHFSHFEKETVRLSEREYQVTLRYEKDDETELLIRVLSFGPMIRVTEPESFVDLVRERLRKQTSCGL